MGPDLGPIAELARHLAAGLVDDVGDLAGEAGHVELGGVDDLDADHVLRRDRLQGGDRVGRLAGDALAVDQHVARGLAEAAARAILAADREAGHLAQHVERGLGREAGEVGRRVDALAVGGRRGDRGGGIPGRRRRFLRRCGGGQGERQQGGAAEQSEAGPLRGRERRFDRNKL